MGRHLTDEEIQEYLDNKAAGEIQEHLAKCAHCEKKIRQYQLLFREIENPIPVNLSQDFSATVLDRVIPGTIQKTFYGFWEIFFVVLGLAGCLGLSLYLIGIEKIRDIYNEYALDFSALSGTMARILQFTESLGLDYGLLALGLFSLILVSLFDYFFLRQHRLF